MIRGVIFDMDGVLVVNRDIHFEAFKIFCNRHGFTCTDEQLLPLFGKGNEEIIPSILPADYIEEKGLKNLSDEKEELYREIFADKIEPAPGLKNFLNDLRSNDVKCAVGSSGPSENVNFVLDRCGISGMFDAISNGDMVKHAKPDPEVFLLAAELLELPKSECIVIEDAFVGIEAANRAGIKAIGMATTYPAEKLKTADIVMLVSSFNELSYEKIKDL